MATRPNGRASAWAADPSRAGLLPFAACISSTTCPKCGIGGWFPRHEAQWHPAAVSPECPPLEHLHAACPGCGHGTCYLPADAVVAPDLASYWLS